MDLVLRKTLERPLTVFSLLLCRNFQRENANPFKKIQTTPSPFSEFLQDTVKTQQFYSEAMCARGWKVVCKNLCNGS